MQSLTQAIHSRKPPYKHFLLLSVLFFSLPTGTIHTTSMKQEPDETQINNINNDLDDEKDPKETIIENTKEEKKTDKLSFDVEKLQHLIKTTVEEVEKYETKLENNEMVYFYGNAGAGKSTIINYLLGNELEKYYPEDEKNLTTKKKHVDDQNNTNTQSDSDSDDFTCGVQSKQKEKIFRIRLKEQHTIVPRISPNPIQSETIYPCPYFPKNHHQLGYCDTAGFSDTKGIENIVCTYIGNNLIIQKSKKLKAICFVTYKSALETRRGEPFLDSVISTISNFIKKTKERNPLDSIFILLNNKSQIDNVQLVAKVFDMLNDFRKGFKKSKQNDQQNAQKYETYINILEKILKDSSKKETMRILAINPLDKGESRKTFLQRISTSPFIHKNNLKKIASKQGGKSIQSLQKEILQQTEPILDRILTLQQKIKDPKTKTATMALQIQNFKKEKEKREKTIKNLQKQSHQAKKNRHELEKKITNIQKDQEEIKKQIDELELYKTSSDYSKETENLLSEYENKINRKCQEIVRFEKKQDDIDVEVKRLDHKIEENKEQIGKFEVQLKKEQQQIDQMNHQKKQLLYNTTQERIINLAKKQKNWFDYYQNLLTRISQHWFETTLEPNVFKDLEQKITTQLQVCNTISLTLKQHTFGVNSVAFNPSGTLLASGSYDKTIKLWNTTNGQCTKTLQGHTNTVFSVAFNPQGTLLASGSEDNSIKLWDTINWQCIKTLQGHKYFVFSVAFNPQGTLLASGSEDNSIKLWDTRNWQCIKTLQGHTERVFSVAFNPQGTLLASGSFDKTITLWYAGNWQCIKTLQGHEYGVSSVTFKPSGDLLASGSLDKTIKLWNIRNLQCIKTLKGHKREVFSVAFNPQGTLLASGSDDKTIKLWETTNWQCTKTLKGHTSWLCSVAFNSSGTLLASGSWDNMIKLWYSKHMLDSTSNYTLLYKEQFKRKTAPHLKKITKAINLYYQAKTHPLENSDAQQNKKRIQAHMTFLQKKMDEQKQKKTNLQKQIDSLNSKVDDLENKKLQQIQFQIKNKQTKDQLDYYMRQKEKNDTILHNLQQDRTQQDDILNDLSKQLVQVQTKHDSLLEKIGIMQGNHQEASEQLQAHQKELIDSQGMLERKQPSIDLILKIDRIVPIGLIAYSFIQKYMQCKTNNKHM